MVGEVEIDQKIGVRPVDAIVRLPGGLGQDLLEQPDVQMQQEGAMEQEKTAAAALSQILLLRM